MARNRIKGIRKVRAGDLIRDERNWRFHPRQQQNALRVMLERVGMADALIVRETDEGLVLVDGHLRASLLPSTEVTVTVVDLNEEEAAEAMATLDPLSDLAGSDVDTLSDLVRDFDDLFVLPEFKELFGVPMDTFLNLEPTAPGEAPKTPPVPQPFDGAPVAAAGETDRRSEADDSMVTRAQQRAAARVSQTDGSRWTDDDELKKDTVMCPKCGHEWVLEEDKPDGGG